MKQNDFIVRVHRTDKIDISDKNAPLPPSRGLFDEYRVADHFCPPEWSKDGVFIPVEEDEPLWFDFRGSPESACVPSVQRLNPLTGKPADLEEGMTKAPEQNYMVLPSQRWLDGYVKGGKVYQFVVTKEGIGLAVSEHVLPEHMQDSHAMGFAFFSPKNPKPVPQPQRIPSGYVQISADGAPYHGLTKTVTVPQFTLPGGKKISANVMRSTNSSPDLYSAEISDISCSVDSVADGAISENCFAAQTDEGTVVMDSGEGEEENLMKGLDVPNQALDKAAMGMGGRIEQTIDTDDNSVDYYKAERSGLLVIYFALPAMFKVIMDKGTRTEAKEKDKYTHSGEVGGVQVPLI